MFVHSFFSIWLIDMTLSGATTTGQSKSRDNGNEEVLHIPQISMAAASPSGGLMSYSGHLSLGVLPRPRRGAVSIFYSPSRLGCSYVVVIYLAFYLNVVQGRMNGDIQWNSNSLVKVCLSSLLTITQLRLNSFKLFSYENNLQVYIIEYCN